MNNKNGDELFVMVNFNNITDQQNYQSILSVAYKKEVQLNKLKSTFIENISHEIRTPFNAISGYAEIMEECIKANDQKTFTELVVLVKEVLSRVSQLFNNIIDMSEIESGEMVIEYTDLNCNQVIKSIHNKYEYLAKRKNIDFQLNLAQEDLAIKADLVKLEKIIYAITENAIKYTEQGKIVIGTYKLNQFAYITIMDTGVGMNQKDIDNLLEPFSQEEQGYTREYQGAGLGLAIASKLTEIMGGMFKIVSRKEKGTKVTLIFPLIGFYR
jgi:signal transduction histidine kinase